MKVGHHGVPHSHPQVLQLLQTATANRSVARTALNDHSSRSHSIFQLRIDGTNAARELRCSCECGWGSPPPFLGLSFLLEPLPVPSRAPPTPSWGSYTPVRFLPLLSSGSLLPFGVTLTPFSFLGTLPSPFSLLFSPFGGSFCPSTPVLSFLLGPILVWAPAPHSPPSFWGPFLLVLPDPHSLGFTFSRALWTPLSSSSFGSLFRTSSC